MITTGSMRISSTVACPSSLLSLLSLLSLWRDLGLDHIGEELVYDGIEQSADGTGLGGPRH